MVRRGIVSRVLAWSAAVLMTLSVAPVAAHAAPEDGGSELERRWSQLLEAHPGVMEDHAEAQALLDAARRRATDARSDLAWVGSALSDNEAVLEVTAGERDRTAARRDAVARRLERARRTLEGSRLRMDAHAATIYKHGAPALGPIESLLRSGSPGDFVLRQRLSEAVLHEDDASVRRAFREVDRVADLYDRAVIQAAVAHAAWGSQRDLTQQLRDLASEQEDHVGATARALGPRSRSLEHARSAEVGSDAAITTLEELIGADDPDRRQVLAERRRGEHAAAVDALSSAYPYLGRPARPRPATLPPVTGYLCPVEGGRFINDWAFPRAGGRSHEGTDVFADQGARVMAVAAGEVVEVDRHDHHEVGALGGDLGGVTVTILTDQGERWYYAHLATVAEGVEVGVAVEAGQQVGTNGDSGNARGGAPHLHLGRYWHDIAVNPYPSLALACD